MGSRKDNDDFRRRLSRLPGIDVRKGKSGHWKVYLDGHLITTLPVSSSDVKSVMAARTTLRKHGVEVPR